MNKYVVAVCDVDTSWIEVYNATSINLAQEKLMNSICNRFDLDNPYNYKEFLQLADDNDIIIGDLVDIETL